jgi:2-keto-4-pentenoate hydratase/2-oxohepta-3-ene-1,7-dioic acid hydratase in catechol pathway
VEAKSGVNGWAGNCGGWLKPGDEVELEIERLGVLRNRLVAK